MRVLIALSDGVPDSSGDAFLPGSIKAAGPVPVTVNFDSRLPPLGTAMIVVEGDRVFADIDVLQPEALEGRCPAVGGRSTNMLAVQVTGGPRLIADFEVLEVGICQQNTDPRIPTITTYQ